MVIVGSLCFPAQGGGSSTGGNKIFEKSVKLAQVFVNTIVKYFPPEESEPLGIR
jgi:hypothetical protein